MASSERKTAINQDSNQENLFPINLENKKASCLFFNNDDNITTKQTCNTSINLLSNENHTQTAISLISSVSLGVESSPEIKNDLPKKKKKRRKRSL